ncbi:putative sugar O-methyltransferase [Acidobacteria bacterium AH-259-D05]|nr:putative sugar O-methyltransferase [Acidobacteria bacterium AH-259-D05]
MFERLTKPLFRRVIIVHKWLYEIWLNLCVKFSYLFFGHFKKAYRETLNLIDDPSLYNIDRALHERCASRALRNYKLHLSTKIEAIYQPGKMWTNILNAVSTFNKWQSLNDDRILFDALYAFYRTDLILAHSGDFYIWDFHKGTLDLRMQVYMLIKRYKEEFLRNKLQVNPNSISTTDVGQNIYVEYKNQKLTFKILRSAYYLDRMKTFNLINQTDVILGELGCGAGELAILTKKMLPDCTYVCFDLPQPLFVSSYNVLMTFPHLKIGLFDDIKNPEKITKEEIQKYDLLMLPNWCIECLERDSIDLFINIGSLSEMDLPIIENYLNMIEKSCRGYFYTVNRNIAVPEWGANDIPLDNFPFSENTKLVYKNYDIASDIFHGRYGRDYKTNYWELILQYKKEAHSKRDIW